MRCVLPRVFLLESAVLLSVDSWESVVLIRCCLWHAFCFCLGRPHCRGLCIALFRGPITVGSVISGSVSNFACDSACSLVHSGTPCRPRFGGPARLRLPSSAPRPLGATFSSLWVGRGRPLSAALPGFSGQGGGLHAVQGDGFGWTDIVFVLSALSRERRCPFIYIYICVYIYKHKNTILVIAKRPRQRFAMPMQKTCAWVIAVHVRRGWKYNGWSCV